MASGSFEAFSASEIATLPFAYRLNDLGTASASTFLAEKTERLLTF